MHMTPTDGSGWIPPTAPEPRPTIVDLIGVCVGMGAAFGAFAVMLGAGPVLAAYADAIHPHGFHAPLWQVVIIGFIYFPATVPIGVVLGAPIGLVIGIALATYVRPMARDRGPETVARSVRPMITMIVALLAMTAALVGTATKGSAVEHRTLALVYGVIPFAIAWPLAMLGAKPVRRKVLLIAQDAVNQPPRTLGARAGTTD
jgi:hypothetical protein